MRGDCIGATVVIPCFHSAQPCEYFEKKKEKNPDMIHHLELTLIQRSKVQRLNHRSASRQKRASSSCAKSSRVSGQDCLEGEIGQM